jgi:Cu/Ag efflux pump CusA
VQQKRLDGGAIVRWSAGTQSRGAAIGGLLPLALEGSSLYSPLAWMIIGGLISSTILARLVTPLMYKLLAPAVEVRVAA